MKNQKYMTIIGIVNGGRKTTFQSFEGENSFPNRIQPFAAEVKTMSAKDTIRIENGSDNYNEDRVNSGEEDNSQGNAVNGNGKLVKKYAPIVRWLPGYSRFNGISDLIAGITLGLTMIPQSIAYASLAGLTAQYGLYSSFIGGFIYVIFGTIKEVSIGPTSLMALVSISYTRDLPPDFIILLCFLTGCVQLSMGLFNLGFLVDFISIPVTSGFTSATAVIIIVSQLRYLFGIKYKSGNVLDTMIKLFKNFDDIQTTDMILGLGSVIFLLAFRKLKDVDCTRFKGSKGNLTSGLLLEKFFWLLSISRNAIAVVITSVIAYNLTPVNGKTPFLTAGKVESGLPGIALPPFSVQVGNKTYSFYDMCHQLGFGLIMVPLVGVLTNVAIAKAFVHDAPVEASQEMLTLGLCNISGSFFSSMPTCGAFTRSAVSSASGIQTPMAGLYSGSMALLALSFLTPYFGFIPKSTLAAVLICAVIFMVDLRIIQILWSGSKRDAFTAASTFIMSIIFNVEIGLFIGTGLNAIFLLYLSARPSVEISLTKTIAGNPYLLVKPEIGLFYPAIDFLSSKITRVAAERGPGRTPPIVVDFERLQGIDYTAVKGIERLQTAFKGKKQKIFFLNVSPQVRNTIFKLCGEFDSFRFIDSSEDAVVHIFESELGKSPTVVPVLAIKDEKGMQLEKRQIEEEKQDSSSQEYESLLQSHEKFKQVDSTTIPKEN